MKVGGFGRRSAAGLKFSSRDYVMLLLGILASVLTGSVIHLITVSQTPLSPVASTTTIRWLPQTVKRWETPIDEMAKKYDIDPNLLAIIMTLESGGYSKAMSADNAQGLMQITPPTAADIAKKFLKQPVTKYDLNDPRTNIEFGAAYLSYLRDEFATNKQGPDWNSSVELIAAGYNGGPGAANNLEKGRGLSDTQIVIYSRDAYNMWRERHSATSPTFDRWKERGGSSLINLAAAEK